jgi:hypothetical protein
MGDGEEMGTAGDDSDRARDEAIAFAYALASERPPLCRLLLSDRVGRRVAVGDAGVEYGKGGIMTPLGGLVIVLELLAADLRVLIEGRLCFSGET